MDSIKQLFSYLNDVRFPYVVLRNWDSLPYDVCLGEHSDLDLLVYDREHFMEIFPEAKLEHPFPRVRTKIPVGGSFIYLDVRYIGDDYYPEDFERSILETREWNERGFFTPNPMHHRIALAYHAVHHKNAISDDYRRFLGPVKIEELLDALKISSVGWVTPKDKSVGSYNGYWKGATAIVEKDENWAYKTQVGYMEYKLLKNEEEILRSLSGKHFPRVSSIRDEKRIAVELCGELLSVSNCPANWREQVDEIMEDLKADGVQHRDIKLDNLMVKDGVLKLIDFGWAVWTRNDRTNDPAILLNPPSCLGYPNKPSDGFNDAYSMRRVVKQLDYLLEEAGVMA